jgi:hypothetical protein
MRVVFNTRSLMFFGLFCTLLVAWRVAGTTRVEAPPGYAAGTYAWERGPRSDDWTGSLRFRWTGGRALLLEEVKGPVLHLPLYLARPDLPGAQVVLHVSLDGVPADRVIFERNGWHQVAYDLRTVLGKARWAALEAQGDRHSMERRNNTIRAIWVQLRVEPTFVPAAVGESTDARTLGVGVGELAWSGDWP